MERWEQFPCKLWDGALDRDGYGRRFPQVGAPSMTMLLHRQVWEQHVGRRLTPDECVLHHCDVRNCYEVEHLWEGTRADNNADRASKGRNASKTHCRQGHEMTTENTKHKRRGRWTVRVCLTCHREWSRRSAQRRRDRLKESA